MKEVIKHIVLGLVVAMISAYLIGAAVWFTIHTEDPMCEVCSIQLKDSLERSYVTPDELETMLHNTKLHPVNKPCSQISTQAIEQCVLAHPMVRTAQCFITTHGATKIDATQRIPLLKVEMEGNHYFIDTDRLRMPVRSSITTPVLPVRGRVEERMAKGILWDIADYIQHRPYWETRFKSVYVAGPNAIELVDTTNVHILIGDGQEYIAKLNKLQTFENQMRGREYSYSVLDLRYQNQVIGRK